MISLSCHLSESLVLKLTNALCNQPRSLSLVVMQCEPSLFPYKILVILEDAENRRKRGNLSLSSYKSNGRVCK